MTQRNVEIVCRAWETANSDDRDLDDWLDGYIDVWLDEFFDPEIECARRHRSPVASLCRAAAPSLRSGSRVPFASTRIALHSVPAVTLVSCHWATTRKAG
jgi:hypothetical protein